MIKKYKDYVYGQVDYWCLSTDVPKLPKKADNKLGDGSSAYCKDTGDVYLYDEENDIWIKQ